MNYTEEALEFNLKDLLFYIFYRWKAIVMGAVLMAMLLGVAKAYPVFKAASNLENEESLRADQQSYYDQLDIYARDVEAAQRKVDALQEYMNTSILMNADSRNIYLAKSVYYIDTNYQIILESQFQNPNRSQTLAWHYKSFLQNSSTYAKLAETMGIDAKYLMELVTVNIAEEDTLAVSVAHPQEAAAQEILNHLNEMLLQYQQELATVMAAHDLTLVSNSCGLYIYDTIEQVQMKTSEHMLLLLEELNTKTTTLKNYQKSNAPSSSNPVSTFIKWGLVGGCAGGILMVGFFFLLGIFDNRVYSPDYLAAKYSIPFLGGMLPEKARFDFVTKWLRSMECLLTKNSPENLQYLAVNTENHAADARNILICCDTDSNTAQTLSEALQKSLPDIHFTAAGSLLQDAGAVSALPCCQRVLLVFTRSQTNHKYIRKTLNLIQECGKEIVGFIFVG